MGGSRLVWVVGLCAIALALRVAVVVAGPTAVAAVLVYRDDRRARWLGVAGLRRTATA